MHLLYDGSHKPAKRRPNADREGSPEKKGDEGEGDGAEEEDSGSGVHGARGADRGIGYSRRHGGRCRRKAFSYYRRTRTRSDPVVKQRAEGQKTQPLLLPLYTEVPRRGF
jgi:hypothetical protein